MKITILGSGAWEGVPAPFCSCSICISAWQNPSSKNNRTRPQLLVETEEGKFLVEISPDIRLQSAKFKLPTITNFVVSHGHFDHMYGLHELLSWTKRLSTRPIIYCSKKTKELIDKEFSYIPFGVNVLDPFKEFVLLGVTITPLPVFHMFENDKINQTESLNNTFGFMFEHEKIHVAYLSDYYSVPQETLEIIKNVDVLIADGTYLSTDEYKGKKSNHMHSEDIVNFARSIGAKSVYYHSISHLTKKTHEELQNALPATHFVTYDGMEINLAI